MADVVPELVIDRGFGLSPWDLWELMWRSELQPRWLGRDAEIRLRPNHRFSLSDAGGLWRRGRVVAMTGGRAVAFVLDPDPAAGAPTSWTLSVVASSTGGSRIVIGGIGVVDIDDSMQFWSQALNALQQMVAEIGHRRENPRQAVVVIHGIGEQEPGRTLTNFVNAAVGDTGERWVKPDRRSPLFELRRITVNASPRQVRPTTDVYELYWAHVIRDTTIGQLVGWIKGVLLRPHPSPGLVPLRWLVFFVAATIAALQVMGSNPVTRSVAAALPIAAGVVWKLGGRSIALDYLGDAARYLSPKPANVAHRQAIREAGVDLLEDLHRSGEYDRVVVVGHSLGSVIAYDILTFAWMRMHGVHAGPRHPAFGPVRAVEKTIATGTVAAGPAAQTDAWTQTRRNTQPWLVSDLITLGSPLAYATTLMASNADEFATKIADRVLPTCPPRTDNVGRCTFESAYPNWSGGSARSFTVFDHGAVFATTRWTNLYFTTKLLGFGGDPVGGPVQPVFGDWVCDVPLSPPKGLFSHTRYWDRTARAAGDSDGPTAVPAHIQELRLALELSGGPELIALSQMIPAFALLPNEQT